MEETEVRKWLEDNNYTAYEIHKEVSLSLQGIHNFIKGDRKPQRKTLIKLEEFVLKKMQKYQINDQKIKDKVREPNNDYISISNFEIFNAIQSLTDLMSENGILVTELLSKTYQNTKTIIKTTHKINDETLRDINQKLINLHHE